MGFTAEKVHAVGGTETGDGGVDEIVVDGRRQRIDRRHLVNQEGGPLRMLEFLGQFGGRFEIRRPDNFVVAALMPRWTSRANLF